jgi:hypothetical protein
MIRAESFTRYLHDNVFAGPAGGWSWRGEYDSVTIH